MNVRCKRRLIQIVDPSKATQVRSASFGIETLRVALFADCGRCINECEGKLVSYDHVPDFVPWAREWTYGSADNAAIMSNDLSGDETNAPYVGVAILAAKSQALRQMGADDITVKDGHAPAVLE